MGETPCGFKSHPGHSLRDQISAGLALAPVDGPRRTGATLRDFLDLGGRARRRGRALETTRRHVHDPDRDRRKRRVPKLPATVAGLDPSTCAIVWVVKGADRG